MISMVLVFYMFLGLFALIGIMRGWAKELLVIFSVVLALAFIVVIEKLVPVVREFLQKDEGLRYTVRMITVLVLVMFGYQSPKLPRFSQKAESRKDRIQDILLGLVMGVLSGYFVIGTIWAFAAAAGYPGMEKYIIPLQPTDPLAAVTDRVLKILPPVWLYSSDPLIFIAVVMCFVIVIVVFV